VQDQPVVEAVRGPERPEGPCMSAIRPSLNAGLAGQKFFRCTTLRGEVADHARPALGFGDVRLRRPHGSSTPGSSAGRGRSSASGPSMHVQRIVDAVAVAEEKRARE
jgi:hypothetical protein